MEFVSEGKHIRLLSAWPGRIKFILSFLLLLFVTGCKEDPVSSQKESQIEGSWLIWSPLDWTHDGKPFQSEYCIVFSDGATPELKQRVGAYGDQKFLEVLAKFGFTDMGELRYPPGHSKIDIYINCYHTENIAAAYWGSIFLTMRSTSIDLNRYDYLFKHELTHGFEFLIEGKVNLGTDVWFREGLAVYIGGVAATSHGAVDTEAELDAWLIKNSDAPNLGNPVTIHEWQDFPEGADITHYYVFFELAVRYLLTGTQEQRSLQNVVNLFYDIREGMPFSFAFEDNFGIRLAEYQTSFYERIRQYL